MKMLATKLKSKAPCMECLSKLGFGCVRIGRMVLASPSGVRRMLSPEYAEKSRMCVRNWAAANPEKAKLISDSWRLRFPEKHNARRRKWGKLNREKAARSERVALRNPQRKIASNIRRRIRECVFETKRTSSFMLTGCDWKSLRGHLESQFTDGMTWSNYGVHGWHIDHIKPLSAFDLTNEQEIKTAFHYSNLQPLWAAENIRKHNKYENTKYEHKTKS